MRLAALFLATKLVQRRSRGTVQMTGFVLPTGHLLCLSCFTDWEAALLAQLNITRAQPCFRDAKGTCQGCTLATAPSSTRLRHLLVCGHLRDLGYHFLHHLPSNTMNQSDRILVSCHSSSADSAARTLRPILNLRPEVSARNLCPHLTVPVVG
jgi:hypothetical protein